MIDAKDSTSTRPYLVRAMYEWCTDNGFTPYVAVLVDDTVRVPVEYVKDGEIVLNISYDATSSLKLGNEFIEFKARFAGTARDIMVPVSRVVAIYARENGQGMAFPMSVPSQVTPGGQSERMLGNLAAVKNIRGEASEAVGKGFQLSAVSPELPPGGAGADAPGGSKMPPPSDNDPPPPRGPRPALKRVK